MKIPSAIALVVSLAAPLAGASPQGSMPGPPSGDRAATPRRTVAVFLGPQGGFGDVRTYDEASGVELAAPPELENLALLDLDFVGRSDLDSLLEDRAQRRPLATGARLVLPRGAGSIYHFERALPGGARSFGFLWVRSAGDVVVVGERPGSGAVGTDDPWLPRLGIGPEGRGFLAATRASAGGDLFVFELHSGIERNLTAQLAPRSFSVAGLWLHATWGLAASDEGVLRFGRQASAARPVDFGSPAPAHFSAQVAVSKNRAFAVTTAGSSPADLHVYVLGASGPAQRVSAAEAPVTPAGYLPEHPLGPYLAVAGDGSCAAWRADLGAREVFLARVQAQPTEVQITGGAFFDDTMNEVGLLGFYDPARLHATVGERDTTDPLDFLENTDVYEVTLDATDTPSFANLTRTSGDAQAPFLVTGTIEPKAMRWVPGAERVLVHDGSAERVLSIDPTQPGPARVLIGQVKDVDWVEQVEDELLLSVRRDFGSRPREVHRLSASLDAPSSFLTGGPDDTTQFLLPTPSDDGWLSFVRRDPGAADRLQRFFGGSLDTLPPMGGTLIPPMGSAPGGATLLNLQAGAGAGAALQWTLAGPTRRLRTPAGIPVQVLPAR